MTLGGESAGKESPSQAFYDIAQLLESADDAEARVTRALTRLRSLVPYERCAVLDAPAERAPRLFTPKETPLLDREALKIATLALFHRLAAQPARSAEELTLSGMHLAVPLVGLDSVVGVLLVERAEGVYDEQHLRSLSVVAAKLAAYFSMLHAFMREAARSRELAQAKLAADAADRAKDAFLALVSHELRTPLNSILTWADALRSNDTSAADRSRAFYAIERAVRAQAKLVADLLDLAGVASATLRLDLHTVDPRRVINDAISTLEARAKQKAIRLVVSLDAAVKPFLADPYRLSQVVVSLVGNAIRFTPSGGRVEVRLDREGLLARIRVTDDGLGISAALLPKLFEPFSQVDSSTTREQGGLGVGLALVKDLVELHGGRVSAESAGAQRGSTFTVLLPLAESDYAQATLQTEPVDAGGLASPALRPLDGVRVLIVDDDRDIGEVLQFVLEAEGALVSVAHSAAEALGLLTGSMPDVLLSDLAMPGGSGYDLMRSIVAREGEKAPPAVALSAYAPGQDLRQALAAGFRMLLEKPIDSGTLIKAVTTLVADGGGKPPISMRVERAIID
ncbi:MAG TPA: ATP-binding protein [Polyangiaceae bacterium]|nr:ATP-binding protein [Polyangiaceae bacterium]